MSIKMSKQLLTQFPLLLIFLCCPTLFAQSPAQAPVAQSPAQSPPAAPSPSQAPPLTQPLVQAPAARSGAPNITAILEKAGHFTILIRLLKSTKMDDEIHKDLNDSSQGLTVFAPTDNAFGSLTTGALNSYSDQQKFQLVKFHLISSFLSLTAFQTVSNPASTEAGSKVEYPMNITTSGNLVNISTGIVNTTISGTVYSDNQLAVYQVERVLLPLSFFVTPAPALAPAAPLKPAVKEAPSPSGSSTSTAGDSSVKTSGAIREIDCHAFNLMFFAGFLVAALSLCI